MSAVGLVLDVVVYEVFDLDGFCLKVRVPFFLLLGYFMRGGKGIYVA